MTELPRKKDFAVLLTEPTWICKEVEEAKDLLGKIASIDIRETVAPKEVLTLAGEYDAILADERVKYDEDIFKRGAGKLKIISLVGEGYENVDLDAATKHGVMVTNTPGTLSASVAEHTILLLLAAAKDLLAWDMEIRQGIWDHTSRRGMQIWGRTHGQIGLGKIGFLVAKALRDAFNMHILVYDPWQQDQQRITRVGGEAVELETLLRESDTLSINLPLTKDSYHLIGYREFKAMKNSAVLVNTGRGQVIDEEALVKALREGEIAKAALDVFHEEPLANDNPLLKLSNVVLTPHIAWNTLTATKETFMQAAVNVVQALQGKIPQFVLNKALTER